GDLILVTIFWSLQNVALKTGTFRFGNFRKSITTQQWWAEVGLAVSRCEPRPKQAKPKPAKKPRPVTTARPGSNWNKSFDLQKSVPIWKAASSSGARPQELP